MQTSDISVSTVLPITLEMDGKKVHTGLHQTTKGLSFAVLGARIDPTRGSVEMDIVFFDRDVKQIRREDVPDDVIEFAELYVLKTLAESE